MIAPGATHAGLAAAAGFVAIASFAAAQDAGELSPQQVLMLDYLVAHGCEARVDTMAADLAGPFREFGRRGLDDIGVEGFIAKGALTGSYAAGTVWPDGQMSPHTPPGGWGYTLRLTKYEGCP